MADNDNKTEEPTTKRLEEAWAEGRFPRAQELSVVATLLSVFSVLVYKGKVLGEGLLSHTQRILQDLSPALWNDKEALYFIENQGLFLSQTLTPFLVSCFLGAILVGGLQTRFRFSPKVLEPKVDRLNPIAGLKRIFSKDSWILLGVDGLKFVAISWILYAVLKKIQQDPLFYTEVSLIHLQSFLMQLFLTFLWWLILFLGVIALTNYFYQRHKVFQELRMTLQEMKDERRQSEGDPKIKLAQRQMFFRLFQRQMLAKVPCADVIVTNPTHYAVALKYERGKDKAPVVLAKGQNLFAQRIRSIAETHGVPVREEVTTARLLYRLGKVGEPIPQDLYEMVAKILSYVYQHYKSYFAQLPRRRREIQF